MTTLVASHFVRSMSRWTTWGMLMVCVGVGSGAGQTRDVLRISVNDARPLMVALDELEKKTGWIITYEDPEWMSSDDLQDRSALTGRVQNGSTPQTIPRGGPFTFTASPRSDDSAAQVNVVETLLQDYGLSPVGRGRFRLVESSGTLHVVPAQAKNASGQFENRTSLLDVTVAMGAGTSSAMEATTELAQLLSATSGKKVGVFFVPNGLFINSKITTLEGATPETGRVALSRIIAATGRRLSWRLTYLPDAYQGYALSVHEVPDPMK